MKGSIEMIKFECKGYLEDNEKTWWGYISKLFYFGSHMQIFIESGDPISADVCKTLSGFFVFFIDYEAGLNLSSLFDIDENADRLLAVFDGKDAVTVAYAINEVGYLLPAPRRRNRPPEDMTEECPF